MGSIAVTSSRQSDLYLVDKKTNPERLQDIFRPSDKSELLQRGDYLYSELDDARYVYLITSGVIGTVKILADGRRLITRLLFPDDIFGYQIDGHRSDDAVAMSEVRILRLSKSDFQRAIDANADLREQFIGWLHRQVDQLDERALLFAKRRAEERVAGFLLQFLRRKSQRDHHYDRIELPLSRADMADYLGLTIETVSRVLSGLVHDGIIEPQTRYSFVLRKPGALRRIATGDDDFICLTPVSRLRAV